MREIKFRVWDWKRNKMYNVFCLYSENCVEYRDGLSVVKLNRKNGDKFEIMQYTGIKDKNDNEVYEGDILKFSSIERVGIVKYNDEFAEFYVEFEGDGEKYMPFMFPVVSGIEFEVIGNIYENFELTEGGV